MRCLWFSSPLNTKINLTPKFQDAAGIWRTEFPRCLRHKGQIYAVNHSEARNADSCVESSVGGGVRVPLWPLVALGGGGAAVAPRQLAPVSG